MKFPRPLVEGRLLRRYKRFLADVRLPDGSVVTAHTANTGAMAGCSTPGARVWLDDTAKASRKYPLTWELVEAGGGTLAGINTLRANHLVREGIENGRIAELQGYESLRMEAAYGEENSRVDLLLEGPRKRCCFVEVKNVTLVTSGIALFPDAVSRRGAKHLRELAAMARKGQRAVIFFCVQREDATAVRPADAIDPAYGQALRLALAQGVEALAYQCRVSTTAIEIWRPIPVDCPAASIAAP